MTQQQQVLDLFGKYPEITVKQAAQELQIRQPNIRRILGQGALKGVFKRLSRGVYTLTDNDGTCRALIQLGKAQEALPELEALGQKFDSVFLDIPYFSRALIGGNRGIKSYDFLSVPEFATCMKSIYSMLKSPDSHVYLMLSGAPTAQKDMEKYLYAAIDCNMKYVAEGKYQKMFANGKPVTNVRGDIASAERLILLTQSGSYRPGEIADLQLDFQVERPAIKTSYTTQKNPEFLDRLILQSTFEEDEVLDCCAGSGMFGVIAAIRKRYAHLIETLESTIENYIVPNFQNQFAL